MGTAIVWLVNTVIGMMVLLIFVRAILSWLVVFDVINLRNRFAYEVVRFLEAITDPILKPFSRIIPRLGQVDISPIVVVLGLIFIRIAFNQTLAPLLMATLL